MNTSHRTKPVDRLTSHDIDNAIKRASTEQSKQDGKLSQHVTISAIDDLQLIIIQECGFLEEEVLLEASEALSLLTWLQQKKSTLEQWIKEQKA